MSDALQLVVGACVRPAKRARMSRQCKGSSTIPFIAAFSAMLPEHGDSQSRCEAFTLESQCTFGLAAEAKWLRERKAECKKETDAAAKTIFNGRRKKRASATNKQVVAL